MIPLLQIKRMSSRVVQEKLRKKWTKTNMRGYNRHLNTLPQKEFLNVPFSLKIIQKKQILMYRKMFPV